MTGREAGLGVLKTTDLSLLVALAVCCLLASCFSKEWEVTLKIEMLGWVGTALVVIAYVPQIRHLYVEKCAWGISISTWLIWLVAGALLLTYCILRNETLFTFVQSVNITAIIATILLARRSNQICSYHFASALAERVDTATSADYAADHTLSPDFKEIF